MTELIRDRYQPLEEVGRGGQGQVLRALDHLHNRQVALKVRRVDGQAERRALLAEARTLLSLEPHAGLPLVREDFFAGDCYYLVMDWVEGKSLQQLLDERGDPGLGLSTVLGYLDQVAAALDHLHAHEPPIVHQDVKPANLILGVKSRVVLVDFGISTPAGHAHRRPLGTVGYVAPEILAGGPATPATDVYGLAVTAFALLTGSPPQGDRPAWQGLRSSEAGAVERAIRRGLSTDPGQRPGSAGELVERLRAWLEPSLPSGTITLLMTDIEQAGRLWEQHPAAMEQMLARRDTILTEGVERHAGTLVGARVEDDSLLAVFGRATDAVACALDVGRCLAASPWPGGGLPVRMALHSGEAEPRQGRYAGAMANRCAALRAFARGGEILLSQPTRDLIADGLPAGASLRHLGSRTLEGLARPEQVYRLEHPELSRAAHRERTEPLPLVGPPMPPPTGAGVAAAGPGRAGGSDPARRPRPGMVMAALAVLGLGVGLLVALGFPLPGQSGSAGGALPPAGRIDPAGGQTKPAGGAPPTIRRVHPAAIAVTASSELAPDRDSGLTYFARNTLDGDLGTAWNDGVGGVGIGQTLTYTFDRPLRLVRVDAVNGYAKSSRRYGENARIQQAVISTDTGSYPVTFSDHYRVWQRFDVDLGVTSSVTLEVVSVHPGSTYRDVALTEIAFWEQVS